MVNCWLGKPLVCDSVPRKATILFMGSRQAKPPIYCVNTWWIQIVFMTYTSLIDLNATSIQVDPRYPSDHPNLRGERHPSCLRSSNFTPQLDEWTMSAWEMMAITRALHQSLLLMAEILHHLGCMKLYK